MSEIDLSPEALQKRREIAEKAMHGEWLKAYPTLDDFDDGSTYITTEERQHISKVEIAKVYFTVVYCDEPNEFNLEQRANSAHIAANSPDAVIAMIEEIERLRKENSRLLEIWKTLPPALMEKNASLEKEADWLASRASELETALQREEASFDSAPRSQKYWREAARNAVSSQEGLASCAAERPCGKAEKDNLPLACGASHRP